MKITNNNKISLRCDICSRPVVGGCVGHLNIVPTKGLVFRPEGIDSRLKDISMAVQSGRTGSEQKAVIELEAWLNQTVCRPMIRGLRS